MTKKNRAADLRLRKHFHITLSEYSRVLELQEGCCAICKKPASKFKTRLAVDHKHSGILEGLLRGLICCWCNRLLGRIRDDVAWLVSAKEYLLNPPFTQVFGKDRFTAPGRIGTKKRAKLLEKMK